MKNLSALVVILYFVAINFYGAVEMLNDKRVAEQNGLIKQYNSLLKNCNTCSSSKISMKWRTPEKKFYQIAYFGGATGIWAGMEFYRHKTAKPGFIYNIPTYMIISYVLLAVILIFILKKNKNKLSELDL